MAQRNRDDALRRPRPWMWLLGFALLLPLLAVAGAFVYINVIKDDPAPRLSLDSSSTSSGGDSSSTTEGAGPTRELAGSYTIRQGEGTVAGYRVKEVLFGQDAEAVGRTGDVTGSLVIDGLTITTVDLEVDLTMVESDEDRRDNQFRGRIMDTDTFPTATFALTQPITLDSEPQHGENVVLDATGNFTIRGVTKEVTFELTGQRDGSLVRVTGSIPVVFADFGIPDASFGPASVQSTGEIEFLIEFEPTS